MYALEITDLRKSYNGKPAVDGVTLTIKQGEFFGFLGPNGAGKTTTINCITGVGRFTEGTIKVFGIDVNKEYRQARRKVGIAPQEFNVDFFRNSYDTLDFTGGYFGMGIYFFTGCACLTISETSTYNLVIGV